MASDLGGDDPDHDLDPREKDKLERELRKKAREMRGGGQAKERAKLLARAVEISRRKSKKAHKDGD